MTPEELTRLVRWLLNLPRETEWFEKKANKAEPQEIGEYLSALANSAALHEKPWGYLLWGVADDSSEIVGTSFSPHGAKVGNQELENWLATQLEPRIDVRIHEGHVDGKHVVLFEVQPAARIPVRFKGVEYIRIGTYKKRLADHPEKERTLWGLFDRMSFEAGIAGKNVPLDRALELLDYPAYFSMSRQALPSSAPAILDKLASDRLIVHQGDSCSITNLGAILFARQLQDFGRLARKALRVVIYTGANRIEAMREHSDSRGYASSFGSMVQWINDQLPQNEEVGQALRREVRMYPALAIRELVANAIIHQDFNVTGAGPMVEIFTDRIEISNPGTPLVAPLRFIDEPPSSRNETLASLLRRMGICEERGSGIDKVVASIELYQSPPPDFRVAGGSTVAVLFAPRLVAQMDRLERIRACYQHACLLFVSGQRMSNASLRKRLGIPVTNYPLASRIIGDTIKEGLIKPYAEGVVSKKSMTYIPFWG